MSTNTPQENKQNQQQQKKVGLPNLGKHLILDFVNCTKVDVNNYEQVHGILEQSLISNNLKIIAHTHKKFEPIGLTELFMLDHGHLTIHTWPEEQSCAIDFYHSCQDNFELVKKVEEYICNEFGWEACTSTLAVPRGKMSKLWTNDAPGKTEILNQVTFVHREKSDYQDIRIYDTLNMGRILLLDGQVQITDELEDNYTIDMAKAVVTKDQDLEHILIIGGGDLLVANYILTHFPNVKKITLCELDIRVIECVKKFFKYGQKIKEAEDKINVVVQDGSTFVEDQAKNGTKYDGIIIDCSDTWDESCPAYSLTTLDFYKNIKQILKKDGKMVQQLSDDQKISRFTTTWKSANLPDFSITKCVTPMYGEDLPLGIVTNSEE